MTALRETEGSDTRYLRGKEIGKAAKPVVDSFDNSVYRTRKVMEHARKKERRIDFPCMIGMNESRKPWSSHGPGFEGVAIRKLHEIDSLANHASCFTNDCRLLSQQDNVLDRRESCILPSRHFNLCWYVYPLNK